MQKTTSVSIGGRAFTCDQAAYEIIQKYLARCGRKLGDNPDKDEILSDIERSIADHLKESLKAEVVSEALAESTIKAIGEIDTETEEKDEKAEPEDIWEKIKYGFRRLRGVEPDRSHKILFGTAAGIGKEFNVDPFWVRLAFLVLSLGRGSGVFLYLVISFLIYNKGRTTQTATALMKDAERAIKSPPYERVLRKIFRVIGLIVRIIAAVVSLIVFMATAIGLTSLVFLLITNPGRLSVLGAYHDWLQVAWILSVGLAVIIPPLLIFITAVRWRRVLKAVGVMAFVWLGVVVVAAASSVANIPRLKTWAIANDVHTNLVYVHKLDGKVTDVCVSLARNCGTQSSYIYANNGVCQYGQYDNYRKDEYLAPSDPFLGSWIPHSEVLKQPVTPTDFCNKVKEIQDSYPNDQYEVLFGNRPLSEQDMWTVTENGTQVTQPSYFFDYLVRKY